MQVLKTLLQRDLVFREPGPSSITEDLLVDLPVDEVEVGLLEVEDVLDLD
jgi:hypothetical protein